MPSIVNESEALSKFTDDPTPILDKLHRSGEPLLLTQNGRDEVVVQDADSYRRMLESFERLEVIASVKEGLRDVAAGRTEPVRDALSEIARKRGLASQPE